HELRDNLRAKIKAGVPVFEGVHGFENTVKILHDNRNLNAKEIVELIYNSSREFTEDSIQEDDITLIIVKVF
ncbi:hypothetical protein HUU42_10715, partial [bacterium]|nr:hypothetical protein [bacterium]